MHKHIYRREHVSKYKCVCIVAFFLFIFSFFLVLTSAYEYNGLQLKTIQKFTDLTDVPSSYSGSAGFCVAVNNGGTGLGFQNCTNLTVSNPSSSGINQSFGDNRYVKRAGDNMSGDLSFTNGVNLNFWDNAGTVRAFMNLIGVGSNPFQISTYSNMVLRVLTNGSTLAINDLQYNVSTQISSLSRAAAIYVIGDSGNVGINTQTPSNTLDVNGDVRIRGHIYSSKSPTILAAAGAGISPIVSVRGTDIAGMISVTTGTLPTLSADIFLVAFNAAYTNNTYVIFAPVSGTAAATLSGVSMVSVRSNTTSFEFVAGTNALTAATTYNWTYHVEGD